MLEQFLQIFTRRHWTRGKLTPSPLCLDNARYWPAGEAVQIKTSGAALFSAGLAGGTKVSRNISSHQTAAGQCMHRFTPGAAHSWGRVTFINQSNFDSARGPWPRGVRRRSFPNYRRNLNLC